MPNPLTYMVGGHHYQGFAIQPVEFIHKNNLGFIQGNIIKYTCRLGKKGKIEDDIKKIIHYAEIYLAMQGK